MALAATTEALEADTGRNEPDWYRWQDPTGRWRAARTSVPTDLRRHVMLVSADTYGELITAALHATTGQADE